MHDGSFTVDVRCEVDKAATIGCAGYKISALRRIKGVSRMDRMRNEGSKAS